MCSGREHLLAWGITNIINLTISFEKEHGQFLDGWYDFYTHLYMYLFSIIIKSSCISNTGQHHISISHYLSTISERGEYNLILMENACQYCI